MKLLNAETAEAFVDGAEIKLSEFTLISREAAKILSNYKQDLDLSSLESLDDCTLEILAAHSCNLLLSEKLLFNEMSDLYHGMKGSINGYGKTEYSKHNLLKLKRIKYKKLTKENYKDLISNGIRFTSMSNDGAVALSTSQGIECIQKAAEAHDESFEDKPAISFGRSLKFQGNSVFKTPDLDIVGACALQKIDKLYNLDHTIGSRVYKLMKSQETISFKKLDEKSFVLWTQGEYYNIREIKDISVGAAKLVADYEGDTGYGSLDYQGFYFDELEEISSEAMNYLKLSYHKIRLPQQFAESIPLRLDLTSQVAEAYANSENADVIKSYTHLCDESAARCLTYFKEMDIVMPGLRVLSTDCAQSLGVFHKRNLQIDSLAKISACGLAELSRKQGTINGLNSKEWCIENSHLITY